MKIVSYNLRSGGKGCIHWNEVLEQFAPEVLLVQESSPPIDHLPPLLHGDRLKRAVWSPAQNATGSRSWGSGVYFESYSPVTLPLPNYRGWVTGAEVLDFVTPTGRTEPLRAFSLHAPTGMGSYPSIVNRILDMLLEYRQGCQIVIGGDFNLSVSEPRKTGDRKVTAAETKIQRRIREEFGLINCWQTANAEATPAQTLRWTRDPTIPFHCDGLFAPAEWSRSLCSCVVHAGERWDSLSDHNPVMAEFVPGAPSTKFVLQ